MSRKPGLTLDEKQKIKSLSALGKTNHAVAVEISRDPKTVKKFVENPETAAEITEIKHELITLFDDLAHRMLTSISEADIEKLSAYQRVISSGICTDKSHMLRGEYAGKEKPLVIINRISIRHQGTEVEVTQPIEIAESDNL
jgi:hypothetical protein